MLGITVWMVDVSGGIGAMLQAEGKAVLRQIPVLVSICPHEIDTVRPGIGPALSEGGAKSGRTVKGIYGWWSEVKVMLKLVCITCGVTILETRCSTFLPLVLLSLCALLLTVVGLLCIELLSCVCYLMCIVLLCVYCCLTYCSCRIAS
jgi:hypothetical protein